MKTAIEFRVIKYIFLIGVLASIFYIFSLSKTGRSLKVALVGAKPIYHFSDISLGMSMDMVRYAKGAADNYYYDDLSDPDFKVGWQSVVSNNELGKDKFKDKKDSDFLAWSWNIGSFKERLEVNFDPITKKVIKIRCYDDTKSAKCVVGDVTTGDSEEYATSLGNTPQKSLEKGGQTMRITHKGLNLVLYLTQKKVYMIDMLAIENDTK